MEHVWLAIFLILATSPSAAEVSNEIVHCGAIENDVARLECFDNLAAMVRQAAHEGIPIDELLGDIRCRTPLK